MQFQCRRNLPRPMRDSVLKNKQTNKPIKLKKMAAGVGKVEWYSGSDILQVVLGLSYGSAHTRMVCCSLVRGPRFHLKH